MTTITPSVIDQISASMSISSLRNQAIASNIANRDTQGYQRLKVGFDRAMWHADDQSSAATITADSSSETVSLEQDLVALSTNSLQYQALARALSRYFSILSAITSSNRG